MSARGLDFNNYAAHLKDGGLCDGLEIWLVSLILQCPINVVQESMVYCTFQSGVDFQCPIMALTGYGCRVMCTLEQMDDEQVKLPLQYPQQEVSKVGCPITAVIETHGPDSASTIEAEISSATDTDMEHMMEYLCFDPVLPEASGMAKA